MAHIPSNQITGITLYNDPFFNNMDYYWSLRRYFQVSKMSATIYSVDSEKITLENLA